MIYEKISIWEDEEYTRTDGNSFVPTLTTYIQKHDEYSKNKKYPAILIFPGGGYEFTSERESECVAMEFFNKGYSAFVLNYTTGKKCHPLPLRDATKAMCIIRDNAKKWGIDSEKIAVIGFSAGGHLALSLGEFFDAPYLLDIKGMKKGKNKPNLIISSYSVITSGKFAHNGSFEFLLGEDSAKEEREKFSLEKHVREDMPPVFLWHTFEDSTVPVENALLFANALKEKNVPFEMHIFPKGEHGLSVATADVNNESLKHFHCRNWVNLCLEWMDIYFK